MTINRLRMGAVCLLLVSLAACDSLMSPQETDPNAFREGIVSVTATPVASKSGGATPDAPPAFHLKVGVDRDRTDIRYPDAINILPNGPDAPVSVLRDDGSGGDRVAGDGIYEGIIPFGCVAGDPRTSNWPAPPPDGVPFAPKADGVESWGCDFELVGPGGECGEWGKCPETAHRSFLWGLIEYDTDVVVCICVTECNFEF